MPEMKYIFIGIPTEEDGILSVFNDKILCLHCMRTFISFRLLVAKNSNSLFNVGITV